MHKLYLIATAATLLIGGGAQAQAGGYGYEEGYLPPPAYAYYGMNEDHDDRDCGDRFTIVGAHAGVTVLGINADGGAGISVGGECYHHHHYHREYAPQAYAPPVAYPQPVYQQPMYARPAYQQPMYPQPYMPAPQPTYQPYPMPPCGCAAPQPQGW